MLIVLQAFVKFLPCIKRNDQKKKNDHFENHGIIGKEMVKSHCCLHKINVYGDQSNGGFYFLTTGWPRNIVVLLNSQLLFKWENKRNMSLISVFT